MAPFQIYPLLNDYDHHIWAIRLLEERWGAAYVVTRGKMYSITQLLGFVAVRSEERVGLITYRIEGEECEIVSLDSLAEGIGVGTALIKAVQDVAHMLGCRRIWLITTNDNLPALGFYQKRGFHLAALYPNALEESRRLKPEIPLVGMDGIPLRDEIELEMML